MAVYVSMLRGINNVGSRRAKMKDLRALYESLGLMRAQTYIASGNVLFESKVKDERKLAAMIESGIEKRFGFASRVVLRSADEVEQVLAANPFAKRKNLDGSKLLVWFLVRNPEDSARAAVKKIPAAPEELHVGERELYCYFPNGIGRPVLKWAAVERAIQVAGTGRNINTVAKLLEIARAMETN